MIRSRKKKDSGSCLSPKRLFFLVLSFILFLPLNAHGVDLSLSWDTPEQEAAPAGYRVYSRTEGQGYDYRSPVAVVSDNACTFTNLDDGKTYFFVVRATGTDGSESGNSNEVVYRPNQAPILEYIGVKSVAEGQLLEFVISGTDVDGDNLIYEANNLPNGASLDVSTGAFSWVPSYQSAGEYSIIFVVTDSGQPGLSDSETVLVKVVDVSVKPDTPRNLALDAQP